MKCSMGRSELTRPIGETAVHDVLYSIVSNHKPVHFFSALMGNQCFCSSITSLVRLLTNTSQKGNMLFFPQLPQKQSKRKAAFTDLPLVLSQSFSFLFFFLNVVPLILIFCYTILCVAAVTLTVSGNQVCMLPIDSSSLKARKVTPMKLTLHIKKKKKKNCAMLQQTAKV